MCSSKMRTEGVVLGALRTVSLVKAKGLHNADKILFALVAFLLLASVALAQSGGVYDVSRWTVDGGGYTFSTGGVYTLGGTIGQPDAAVAVQMGGQYVLTGGFWAGVPIVFRIYLPVGLRNY